jgi:hypothetical protein
MVKSPNPVGMDWCVRRLAAEWVVAESHNQQREGVMNYA